MTEREARIGANEAVFREVNERLEEVNRTFSEMTRSMEIICECGDIQCAQMLSIPVDVYERMRSDATHFAVVPGHVAPDVEAVVAEHGSFDIVQKRDGVPARIAEATDPRA